MKKRLARIVVYFGLLCLGVLVLSHPYVWQSIFGPTIKGEPLWAWQREFRARGFDRPSNVTLWDKALNALSIDRTPLRWIGHFDYSDPELLPVVIGFADDPDERVRFQVIHALGEALPHEDAVKALVQMLDDSSPDVRVYAIGALQGFLRPKKVGPQAESALSKLRELLGHADPNTRVRAALCLSWAGESTPEVRALVLEAAQSSDVRIRRSVYQNLSPEFKNDDGLFAILVSCSKSEPGVNERIQSTGALWVFGKKAVAPLMEVLTDPTRRRDHLAAISVLGAIGPDAAAAIPLLELRAESPDPSIREFAKYALQAIDPRRKVKK